MERRVAVKGVVQVWEMIDRQTTDRQIDRDIGMFWAQLHKDTLTVNSLSFSHLSSGSFLLLCFTKESTDKGTWLVKDTQVLGWMLTERSRISTAATVPFL